MEKVSFLKFAALAFTFFILGYLAGNAKDHSRSPSTVPSIAATSSSKEAATTIDNWHVEIVVDLQGATASALGIDTEDIIKAIHAYRRSSGELDVGKLLELTIPTQDGKEVRIKDIARVKIVPKK